MLRKAIYSSIIVLGLSASVWVFYYLSLNQFIDGGRVSDSRLHLNSTKKVAVIFVHGILGDSTATWTHSSGNYWPTLLQVDSRFSDSSFFSFDYVTQLNWPGLTPNGVADQLMTQMRLNGSLEHQSIVFVAHSMGGFVVQEALRKYQSELKDKVGLIYFLGVPSNGSSIARLATYLSQNKGQYNALLPEEAQHQVDSFHSSWAAVASKSSIKTVCGYEIAPTAPVGVISGKDSAARLCGANIVELPDNHSTISKPAGPTARVYEEFAKLFLEVKSAQASSSEELAKQDFEKAQNEECPASVLSYERAYNKLLEIRKELPNSSDEIALSRADYSIGRVGINWAINCPGHKDAVELARDAVRNFERAEKAIPTEDRQLYHYWFGRTLRMLAINDDQLDVVSTLERSADQFEKGLRFDDPGSLDMAGSLHELALVQYLIFRKERSSRDQLLTQSVRNFERAAAIMKGATWDREYLLRMYAYAAFDEAISKKSLPIEGSC